MKYVLGFWKVLLAQMDMLDDRGKPQYSKLVITVVLVAAIANQTLTTALAIGIICAAYGKSMLLAFLNRTTVTLTDTVQRTSSSTETKAITERREQGGDFEPTE